MISKESTAESRTSNAIFYSVDRRDVYEVGQKLTLSKSDPLGRPFVDLEGWFKKEEMQSHLAGLFPEGLSQHGWTYLMRQDDFAHDQKTNMSYIRYEPQIELVFELVRRISFRHIHSRFQSYFAWESLAEAQKFGQDVQKIYRLEAKHNFRADQQWLRLGAQGITGWRHATQYWSGASTKSPKWEMVLAAPVKVAELIA